MISSNWNKMFFEQWPPPIISSLIDEGTQELMIFPKFVFNARASFRSRERDGRRFPFSTYDKWFEVMFTISAKRS